MGLQLWLADGVRLTLDGIGRPRQYGMGVLVGRRHLSTGVHLRTHTQLGTTPAWFLGRPCGEGLVAAPARAGDLHPQDEAQ
jgi:hypothetical protein